ncbi:hypothetical protein EVAR_69070_1 [Eumeta japonica]|uniref:Uncharacterized protein n=1 Tax=Eumeta variegata TaxID=151549 RepID=A0A4C1ZFG8_EUMVA|nr:hypothetical protein EVAR_69070_1 [Eumeta japonica]
MALTEDRSTRTWNVGTTAPRHDPREKHVKLAGTRKREWPLTAAAAPLPADVAGRGSGTQGARRPPKRVSTTKSLNTETNTNPNNKIIRAAAASGRRRLAGGGRAPGGYDVARRRRAHGAGRPRGRLTIVTNALIIKSHT